MRMKCDFKLAAMMMMMMLFPPVMALFVETFDHFYCDSV
jgi:hypothetical protein